MAILLESSNRAAVNDRPRSSPASRPTGRRRHLTTLNRAPDYSTIPEETGHQLNDPPTEQTSPSQPNEEKAIHCCCCPKSRLLLCSPAYCSKLPDLIIQHQPVIMSADVHFEQQPPISQPIDSLTSKLALVYTSQWVENDVFLPANQSYAPNVHHPMDGNQMNHPQANNHAINRVNNLLNHQRNQDNSGNQENGQQFGQQFGQQHSPQRSQLNKSVDSCSPRIVRCSLNSALYQYNPRLKAKIMMNARRSASVSLPIDHETLRQVGYSLRMISEQFHLQRLQANALMAKEQQSSNVSVLVRWFCKLVVNKLPSITWKANGKTKSIESSAIDATDASPVKRRSPLKSDSVHQTNSRDSPLNRADSAKSSVPVGQPDVVPMVHLVIPVRQRCHSTTDCF